MGTIIKLKNLNNKGVEELIEEYNESREKGIDTAKILFVDWVTNTVMVEI